MEKTADQDVVVGYPMTALGMPDLHADQLRIQAGRKQRIVAQRIVRDVIHHLALV